MAAARDQAARIIRIDPEDEATEPVQAAGTAAVELRAAPASDETARRVGEAPSTDKPANDTPAATAESAAPKSGRRKVVLMGVGALLALAAIAYGVEYYLVGRFMIGTDDASCRSAR